VHPFVRQLQKKGHELQIVTSREPEACDIAREWMTIQKLQLELVGVGYGNSKADATTGFDVYVDDDLDKLEPLVGIVPHLFLFSWGYNQHVNEYGIGERVSSWEELYRNIGLIEASRHKG
jgi:hypothetical protein